MYSPGFPPTHSPPALTSMGQGLEVCAAKDNCMFCAFGTVWTLRVSVTLSGPSEYSLSCSYANLGICLPHVGPQFPCL